MRSASPMASATSPTWTLRRVLEYPFLTLIVFFATIALTVTLYIKSPKGYFPIDDSGFVQELYGRR